MAYKLLYTSKSDKQLSKLSRQDIKKVLIRLEMLTIPFPQNLDIRKMTNTPNFYRLRVGNVRVIFEIIEKKKELWIRKIKYRGGAYK